MTTPPALPSGSLPYARRRLTNKLVMIAIVMVVLQIPLWFINSTRDERAARHDEAVKEVTASWGYTQRIIGPVLVVPYHDPGSAGKFEARQGEARFFPRDLRVSGTLHPRELKRGIYRAQVYSAALTLAGEFVVPPEWGALEERGLNWSKARLICVVSDARGLRSEQRLVWQGEEIALGSGTGIGGWPVGVQAPVTVAKDTPLGFEFSMQLDGSGSLEIVPVAKTTQVEFASVWPDVGFRGAFLPSSRESNEDGFQARWDIGHLGHDLPAVWRSGELPDDAMSWKFNASWFGVELIPSVGEYRTVERAIKYGILFLVTVFAGFFLFEFTGGRSLHVLNYLLVGGALCLFYLALLSLTEFVRFGWAYVWATAVAMGMVVLYVKAVLGGMFAAAKVGTLLGGIYGYLYFVLQLEELSLIGGTVLLFGLLGAVMYATRHLRFDDATRLRGMRG